MNRLEQAAANDNPALSFTKGSPASEACHVQMIEILVEYEALTHINP